MHDPGSQPRSCLQVSLALVIQLFFVLAAFALGVVAGRQDWRWPGSWGQEPPQARETFRPFWETWRLIHREYVDQEAVNDERMAQWAIVGMLASLGDTGHTTYLTPQEVERMSESLKGELYGIGAVITMRKNQVPTIMQTMPNSPARAAGAQAGDVIVEVDGESVQTMSLQQLVQHVRGPAGSKVRLKVLRGTPPKTIELTIERARVDVPDVTWQMLPDVPLAHIAIRNFGQRTDEQLRDAIKKAGTQGAKGLIVDVRGNPGGLKEQAVRVTSQFLKEGQVVFIEKDGHGNTTPVRAVAGGVATDIPLYVLIDEGTASSSEIFAGAIQDHKRGKLIGQRTVGTGTVLGEFKLPDGSAVLLAISQWLTPQERQIWHKGITPDKKVDLPPNTFLVLPETGVTLTAKELADSKDTQLLTAIDLLKKELP
jgi:carboxyl-terminal processing protease